MADTSRVVDMTVAELREVIQETFLEMLGQLEDYLPDPDEGLEFKPEFAESLRAYLRDRPRGRPAEEVWRELGLEE